MIELPEAMVLSKQLNESIRGKRIMNVIAAHSPHKFAWYHGIRRSIMICWPIR